MSTWGKTPIKMIEETGKQENSMVRDHISTSDTSDCLLELAIVPFGNTMNVIYHSRVNQELP